MPVETHVDHAARRVERERETLAAELTALERFDDQVAAVSSTGGVAATNSSVGAGATRSLATGGSADGRRAIRRAFAETVQPHCADDEDEPLLATVEATLGEPIAAALAPEADVTVTPKLRRAIRAATAARRRETTVTIRALECEDASLDEAASIVDGLVDWLTTADERPLSALGFDALQERHERLAAERRALDALVDDRQAHLDGATSHEAAVAVDHRALAASVYEDFPVENPVLATVARLDEVCADAQRAVRDHLVRRA